jgi:hypothetical protein
MNINLLVGNEHNGTPARRLPYMVAAQHKIPRRPCDAADHAERCVAEWNRQATPWCYGRIRETCSIKFRDTLRRSGEER